MSQRPADVRISDFDEPVFSPEVRQMMSAVGPLAEAIPWRLEAALEQAAQQVGLDDFGEDIYSEPLTVFLEGARREGGLSPMGEVTVWGQVVQFLQNRLLVEDHWKRHPETDDQTIEDPIIIVGLPRTGTTHLHNLMSADPALHYLSWWESLEPVPPLSEQGQAFAVDPRWQRAATGIEMRDQIMPYFKRMHDMWPDHAHEEIHLLAIAGSTMFFETLAISESWREWYLGTDQTPWYAYMKRILQLIQGGRGQGRRWILKSPQHLEQFVPLTRVFPEASFVVTHRDPVAITASFTTMAAYSARLSRDPVRSQDVAHYWSDRIERLLSACVRDRELLPSQRSMDVLFHEFMEDEMGTVEKIYALAGLALTPDSLSAMQDFKAEHPRGKHGRIAYDLAGFGIEVSECRERLEFYSQRFGVQREEHAGREASGA